MTLLSPVLTRRSGVRTGDLVRQDGSGPTGDRPAVLTAGERSSATARLILQAEEPALELVIRGQATPLFWSCHVRAPLNVPSLTALIASYTARPCSSARWSAGCFCSWEHQGHVRVQPIIILPRSAMAAAEPCPRGRPPHDDVRPRPLGFPPRGGPCR